MTILLPPDVQHAVDSALKLLADRKPWTTTALLAKMDTQVSAKRLNVALGNRKAIARVGRSTWQLRDLAPPTLAPAEQHWKKMQPSPAVIGTLALRRDGALRAYEVTAAADVTIGTDRFVLVRVLP